MSTLQQIAFDIGTVEVEIAGVTVKGRTLSARERLLARTLFSRPVPPKIPHPGKGSASGEWVSDTTDPAYVAAMAKWSLNVSAVEVAMSYGWKTNDGAEFAPDQGQSPANFAWSAAAAQEILSRLTETVLSKLRDAMDAREQQLAEAARGN